MQNNGSRRIRAHITPGETWRADAGMFQSLTAGGNPVPSQVAVVLSVDNADASSVTTALAEMGIPTLARAFDSEAPRIVAAMNPSLVVVACQPMREADAEAIRLISLQNAGQLLVVDTGLNNHGLANALDAGADQAISSLAERATVRATLGAILRRSGRSIESPTGELVLHASVGALTVDNDTFEVRDGGQLLRLTPTEFRIVAYLASSGGQVRSPGQIMSSIHEHTMTNGESRPTIRAYIRKIRQKLAGCPNQSVEIVSFRLNGYRLQSSPAFMDLIATAARVA